MRSSTCFYLDGASSNSFASIFDFVEAWFSRFQEKPKVILVKGAKCAHGPRWTMRALRAADTKSLEGIEKLEFFPGGRSTIDDTWRPSIYIAVSLGRPSSIFFSVSIELDKITAIQTLEESSRILKSCVAYAFWFPDEFSPLGYYWGISVIPSARHAGAWGKRESRRLSHWRDNACIGILSDDVRHFHSVCDGYIRDTYPVMLLSGAHVRRRVIGDVSLAQAIEQQGFGSLTPVSDKLLWCPPAEKLLEAQLFLDQHGINLSGRRFEPG